MMESYSSQPAEILDEVARVRRETRTALQRMWFPLVLFGTLSCLSAVVSWRLGGVALGIFWMVAGPLGSVLTGLYYYRVERRVGVEVPIGRWMIGVAVILVGAFASGILGGVLEVAMVSAIGPALSISLGYLIFARIERSVALAIVAIAPAALTVAMAASGVSADRVATTLAAAYGIAFLVTGLILQRQELSPSV